MTTEVRGTNVATMYDWARRLDPDGNIDTIVNLLAETNEVIEDMLWVEGNLPTGHQTTVATGIPEPTWRTLYKGVPSTKGTTKQVTDTCGMLEARPHVDVDLARLNGNTAEWRLSEERLHIEGMNQEFANTVFYGDTRVTPERFMGFHARYSDTTADNKDQILDGGGKGSDNTSIWLVGWGPNTVHGIFPKGSKAGMSITDKGEQVVIDPDNKGRYDVLESHYKWDCGLTVRDWRYVVRIANIDVNDLATFNSSSDASANLVRLLVQATEIPPALGMVKPVIYCNKTVRTWMRIQMIERANVNFSFDDLAGKKVLTFDGIPVRRCDKILNTEPTITFA
jgi:hypothetical protein